jgi:ABC-type glycerol-3-phosphate transport system substrate-binding protein
MRMVVIAAATALGLGLAGMSGASAAPASGNGIQAAAVQSTLTQNVRWWHHRHCWWHHGYRHCAW